MVYLSKTEIDISRVHSNGRLVIPSEIRKDLGVGDGDKILWFRNGYGQLCVEKVTEKPKTRFIAPDEVR